MWEQPRLSQQFGLDSVAKIRALHGSKLWIGPQLVVENDGLHGMQERTGSIGLQAGKHAITIGFFERGGGAG